MAARLVRATGSLGPLAAGLLSPLSAAAQGPTGSVPGAEDCAVEPRTETEFLAPLIDVVSIRMLSDGSAFAVAVVTADDDPPIQAAGLYVEEIDGRWLVAGICRVNDSQLVRDWPGQNRSGHSTHPVPRTLDP